MKERLVAAILASILGVILTTCIQVAVYFFRAIDDSFWGFMSGSLHVYAIVISLCALCGIIRGLKVFDDILDIVLGFMFH